MIQAILLDIAGVLYDGGAPVPGSIESVACLHEQPVALRFVTNTSQQSSTQVRQQLERMGFIVGEDQLYTAPAAVISYLKQHDMTCHALVHPNIDREFQPFESDTPDAVVVADAGDRFDYAHLNAAFRHLMHGAQLIAIGDNRYFKRDGELILDAGPFIHALSYAAGKSPTIIGKPSATFYQVIVNSIPCPPEQAIMIGDDVAADCEGALRAGLQACLVKTGKYRRGDEKHCRLPGLLCAEDLAHALDQIGF